MKYAKQYIRSVNTNLLFSSVFLQDSKYTTQVKTWSAAARAISFRKWQAIQVFAINHSRQSLLSESGDRIANIQHVIDEINLLIEPVALRAWEYFSNEAGKFAPGFHTEFLVHFRWACVEIEFREQITTPLFSKLLVPIYTNGHFPCGVTGKDCSVDNTTLENLSLNDIIVV